MELNYFTSGCTYLEDSGGYIYTKRMTTHQGTNSERNYWMCRSRLVVRIEVRLFFLKLSCLNNRKCPGSIITSGSTHKQGGIHKSGCLPNHVESDKLKFYAKLREKCVEHMELNYSEIYYSEIENFPRLVNRVRLNNVRRSMFWLEVSGFIKNSNYNA